MNGILVVDKPAGPTSHDVVRRMRKVLNERSVGHTGTLDPMATGVLVLVLGRATRLAKFLSAGDKAYDATVTLGVSTDTYDAEGEPVGARHSGALPSRGEIDAALNAFRGTFLQQPPAYSAKKIGGERSYKLARSGTGLSRAPHGEVRPQPVSVTARAIEVLVVRGAEVTLQVECSAGFYVRSLAHDLGQRLGTGAHLSALRRTRSGEFTLAGAYTLDMAVEQDPDEIAGFIIPMGQALSAFPSAVLTSEGVLRASHGRDLTPADVERAPSTRDPAPATPPAYVRLLDRDGGLVGIAEPAATPGLLHPSIVLV
jgi:tRNA pseudouridine55 synthase